MWKVKYGHLSNYTRLSVSLNVNLLFTHYKVELVSTRSLHKPLWRGGFTLIGSKAHPNNTTHLQPTPAMLIFFSIVNRVLQKTMNIW